MTVFSIALRLLLSYGALIGWAVFYEWFKNAGRPEEMSDAENAKASFAMTLPAPILAIICIWSY